MKINSITICNFKCFEGINKIDLSINSRTKNIILIYGANGTGKTTILDAIRLCIFGKRFSNNILSKKKYEEYLISAKNRQSQIIKDDRFFIQIDIEIDDAPLPYYISSKREWKIIDKELIGEDFTIFRNGIPLEIVPKEYWEDYIISLFPPYILEYFFFDAEKVKELSIGDNAERILREAIRDLIGLKLFDELSIDIDSLIRKIRRRNIDSQDLRKQILEKENEVYLLEEKINKLNNNIEKKKFRLIELNKRKEIIENEMRKKVGIFANERKENEKSLLKINEELERINIEIKQICEDTFPFVIAYDVCKNLIAQLKKERRLKKIIISKQMLNEINQKLVDRIKLNKTFLTIPKEDLISIKKEINSIFSEIFSELNAESLGNLLHDLTPTEMNLIENFLNNINERSKKNISKTLRQREKMIFKSRIIKDKIKKSSEEDYVKNYIDKLSKINTLIKVLENDIDFATNSKKDLLEKKEQLNIILREFEEQIVCINEEYEKIDICKKIKYIMDDLIDITIKSKIKELEKIITNLYNTLSNKDDMVKEIKIESKELTTKLIGFKNEILNKKNISAGEKEIYSLSILGSLSKISNKKFPLAFDSLLARLDITHTKNIVENFFPNVGEQVIMLAHNRELNEELYNKLKPYISKEYELTFDNKNKIKKSYFTEY